MSERTCSRRDAASLIFNLPGYRVLEAVDLPLGGRRVRVQAETVEDGCPGCGVLSGRVHSWVQQRVKDIPAGGDRVEVVVRKPRLVCAEDACARSTFTQTTEQLPARARCLTRLREALLDAVVAAGRAVLEVAAAFGVAWWTVQHTVSAAAVLLPDVDDLHVRTLGIDEHRYRSVRFFREHPGGPWRRVEPWMTTFVNAACGAGRGRRDRPERGVPQGHHRPAAAGSGQRRPVPPGPARQPDGHPGPAAADPRHPGPTRPGRRPLLGQAAAAAARLRQPQGGRPGEAERHLGARRPTDELAAAWGVKERLRLLLRADSVDAAREARMRLGCAVIAADMPETDRLWDTVTAWWEQIETYIHTRVTNERASYCTFCRGCEATSLVGPLAA